MNEKNYKWWALGFLWVACFLQQGMRQIFPPLAPAIGDTFGASAAFRGSVMSVFTLVYALVVPFSGMAGDFLSRKKIVIFSLAVFSAGVMGAGWAAGILGITLMYGAVNGFGQSFFYPAATSLLQQLHAENKATALSILQLALYSGIILFSFASGKMLDICGDWRVPFKVFGIAGVVWALALVFLLKGEGKKMCETRAVSHHDGCGAQGETRAVSHHDGSKTQGETRAVSHHDEKPTMGAAFKAVFSKPSAILLAIGLGFQLFVDVGFKMWMPTYLKEAFPGMSAASYGLHAVLWHYLGAFAGVMIGSRVADRFVKGRHGIRMEMNILGLVLGVPFIWWMACADTFSAVCWAMGIFGFCRGIYDSNQFASIFDVVAPRYRGSAMGIMLCFAFVVAGVAPVVLGWVKDNFTMAIGLKSLAGFFVAGAAVIAVARTVFLRRDYVG